MGTMGMPIGQNPTFPQQFGGMQPAQTQQASSGPNWGGFVGAPGFQPGAVSSQGGTANTNMVPGVPAKASSNVDDLMSRTMEGVAKMSFEQRTNAQPPTSAGAGVPMNMMQAWK